MSKSEPLAARLLRTRWFVRAPIWIYRLRLGFLFGSRLLMLEHVGRKSGLVRYVVLEVVSRPQPGVFVIVSGFGTKAQWFRNVIAQPRVRVSVGRRYRAPAEARPLSPDEAKAVLADYAVTHPRIWRALEPVLTEAGAASEADNAVDPPQVPVLALHLLA